MENNLLLAHDWYYSHCFNFIAHFNLLSVSFIALQKVSHFYLFQIQSKYFYLKPQLKTQF